MVWEAPVRNGQRAQHCRRLPPLLPKHEPFSGVATCPFTRFQGDDFGDYSGDSQDAHEHAPSRKETQTACCDEVDPCSILDSWMPIPKTSGRRSSKPSKGEE